MTKLPYMSLAVSEQFAQQKKDLAKRNVSFLCD